MSLPFSNSVSFNRHHEKQKGPGTSCQSLFRLQNMFRSLKGFLLVKYEKKSDTSFTFDF